MKICIVIAGRLQSERLPSKLLLPIEDTNLWEIACEKLSSLQDSGYMVRTLCNDDWLKSISSRWNLTNIDRSEESCLIDYPLNKVFGDIKDIDAAYIMWVNPCLPFLKTSTIWSAIERFLVSEYEYGESVIPFNSWLYNGNTLCSPLDLDKMSTKHIKELYQPAHAFRIFPKKAFLEEGKMSEEEVGMYPIDLDEAIDVDTKEDYNYVRFLYNERK